MAASLHNTSCSEGQQKQQMSSFMSIENIHKKVNGSYFVVSVNKDSSVTL